jgi:hypothetical protein
MKSIGTALAAIALIAASPATPAAASGPNLQRSLDAARTPAPADLSRWTLCVGRRCPDQQRRLFAGWSDEEVIAYRDFVAAMAQDGVATRRGIENALTRWREPLAAAGIRYAWQMEGNPIVAMLLRMGGFPAMDAGGVLWAVGMYKFADSLPAGTRAWWMRFPALIHMWATSTWQPWLAGVPGNPPIPDATITLIRITW